MSVFLFIFAAFLVIPFTWSESSAVLKDDLIIFVQIFCLMNFTAGFGMLSGSMFQAVGKGIYALLVTILRTLVFGLILAFLFGIVFDQGLIGVWFGILLGNSLGAFVSYTWVRLYIKGLISGKIKVMDIYLRSDGN
jgi:Na+-driven multidrug efflux pump